jgi:hypothetical protein
MYWKDFKNILEKNSEKTHKFKGMNVALVKVVEPMITIESQMDFLIYVVWKSQSLLVGPCMHT